VSTQASTMNRLSDCHTPRMDAVCGVDADASAGTEPAATQRFLPGCVYQSGIRMQYVASERSISIVQTLACGASVRA